MPCDTSTRSAPSPARRSRALRKPTPPYHQRSARVRPYQPGGHTRRPSTPLALDAVTSEDDVARDECAVVAKAVRGLADRIAERDGSRAIGDDSVERRVARDHLVRATPVPVHGDDHADGAAKALHIAVERAPESRSVLGILGHDRVDDQDRAGKLAVHAADLFHPSACAPGIGKPVGMLPVQRHRPRSISCTPRRDTQCSKPPGHPPVKRVPRAPKPGPHRRGQHPATCGSDPGCAGLTPSVAASDEEGRRGRWIRACGRLEGTIGCMRIVQRGEVSETYGGRFTGSVELKMLQPADGDNRPRMWRECIFARVPSRIGTAIPEDSTSTSCRAADGWECPTASTTSRRASTSWPRGRAPLPRRGTRRRRRVARDHLGHDGLGGRAGERVTAELDTVVAGAGFAGLRAARDLADAGRWCWCSRPGIVPVVAPGHVHSRARPDGRDRRVVVRPGARRGASRARRATGSARAPTRPVGRPLAHRRRGAPRPSGAFAELRRPTPRS